MKKFGQLYDKICSIENLILADEKARKGKANTYGVRKHDKNRNANIALLHKQLTEGTFRTSDYSIFTIYEPKERQIYRLPYFPDRIVHHSIMNVLEPIWMSVFTTDTYSCIKKRGIHAAAEKLKHVLKTDKNGTIYCLKIDIKKFYPSVDHNILKEIIRRKIKDKRLLLLLDEIIDSAPGLPIGNYLSQYFANLYLAYFDHWIKENKCISHYFRYADDIVILGSNKAELHALLVEINHYFVENLHLQVKENFQIFPVESRGIDFVGYVFYHGRTRLRKSIKQNLFRKLSKLNRLKCISEAEQKQTLAPWCGWLKYCDSHNLEKKINKICRHEFKVNR